MEAKTNGRAELEPEDNRQYCKPLTDPHKPIYPTWGKRNVVDVMQRMMLEIPHVEEPDPFANMLAGIYNAHRIVGCRETEDGTWSSVVAAILQRLQMSSGENGSPMPEWFDRVTAIFRGDM